MFALLTDLTAQQQEHDHLSQPIATIITFLHQPRPLLFERDLRQRKASYDFEKFAERIDDSIKNGDKTPLSLLDLGELFLALDRLFFNNSVFGGHVHLMFGWMKAEDSPYGSTRVPSGRLPEMQLHASAHGDGHHFIGTMIHEMIHLLIMQSLNRRRRWCNDDCKSTEELLDGETGHGYWFQQLAAEIEQSTWMIFGREVDLGREGALWEETKTRNEVPSLAFIEHFDRIWAFEPNSETWTAEAVRDRLIKDLERRQMKQTMDDEERTEEQDDGTTGQTADTADEQVTLYPLSYQSPANQ